MGNNNHESGQKKHSPLRHALMMALCCGLPFVLILFLPAIISVFPAAAFLGGIVPFLCPVLMGLMMFMMMRGNGRHTGCHGEKQEPPEETPRLKESEQA